MYELYYTAEFKVDIKKLDGSMRERLKKVIEKILEGPTRFKHLREGDQRYRVRFEVYRVLYRVVGNRVEFVRVGKRDNVYY